MPNSFTHWSLILLLANISFMFVSITFNAVIYNISTNSEIDRYFSTMYCTAKCETRHGWVSEWMNEHEARIHSVLCLSVRPFAWFLSLWHFLSWWKINYKDTNVFEQSNGIAQTAFHQFIEMKTHFQRFSKSPHEHLTIKRTITFATFTTLYCRLIIMMFITKITWNFFVSDIFLLLLFSPSCGYF